MEIEQLCKMASQIASYYETEPDREAALKSVASHLRRYWDPRMRRQLLEYIEASGGDDLSPLALQAIKTHWELIRPPAAA